MGISQLPLPRLEARSCASLHIVTDDALARETGVRVVFTGRAGGVSRGEYAGLNLAQHVGDDVRAVEENRSLLMSSLGAEGIPLVVPSQVHGSQILEIASSDEDALARVRRESATGADGLAVDVPGVAALLCFADCVPVVVVSPTGSFAVVHAGWRGVVAHIAPKAVSLLARRAVASGAFFSVEEAAASFNVYLGPYIHAECFETGDDVSSLFRKLFGDACVAGRYVDMGVALAIDLTRAGVSPRRIADVDVCTKCRTDLFYSYREEGGVCGRHGAIAFRKE